MTSFDLVIPVGKNDYEIIHTQIQCCKKNILGYNKIYIVSEIDLNIDGTIHVPETQFPFTKSQVYNIIQTERSNWYFQQLVKLFIFKAIPDILDYYMIVDADTLFLKPTTFFDEKPLFNFGTEVHLPYFKHMLKLHPSLQKKIDYSGICHHMMFYIPYIKELIHLVETYHKKSFIDVFLESVEEEHRDKSGAAEYEIYFTFLINYHPNSFIIRELKWLNSPFLPEEDYDYVSCHWYL